MFRSRATNCSVCWFLFCLGSHWPTFPQIFIKGEFVGGSDIVLNLHQVSISHAVVGLISSVAHQTRLPDFFSFIQTGELKEMLKDVAISQKKPEWVYQSTGYNSERSRLIRFQSILSIVWLCVTLIPLFRLKMRMWGNKPEVVSHISFGMGNAPTADWFLFCFWSEKWVQEWIC